MDNSEIAVYFSTFHPPLLLYSSIAPMLQIFAAQKIQDRIEDEQ